ncbi:MAG: UDP-N-acetylmuramate dehydrogenase [Clostridiales bacterium]|nr:UDP-N-acetylmuramate dehydrogenase [Clostridiales bacterium]
MAAHTTLRIGGPADLFAVPQGASAAARVLELCRQGQIPCLVVGNGSNLLVADAGIEGVVLCLKGGLRKLRREGDRITAGAGLLLGEVAAFAQAKGLAGFEFAAGIPGTVGGGVLMNCGAYGGELGRVVESSLVLSPDGEMAILKNSHHRFEYRHTALMESGDIVLAATFLLCEGDRDDIAAEMERLAAERRAKQPLQEPSAGSTFKRPPGGFAARLIDEAGLKGLSVGGAMVSPKHAGFLVNTGGATAADMRALMALVQERVLAHSGIWLEPEVRLVGRWD